MAAFGVAGASAAPIPAPNPTAGEHAQTLDARSRVRLSGNSVVGSRLIARWGPRSTARWQTRTGRGPWRTLRTRRGATRILLVVPKRLQGRFVRGQARLDGRWVSSPPLRVGPRLRLDGLGQADHSLTLLSTKSGPVRWFTRAPGGKWQLLRTDTSRPVTTRRLALTDELVGHRLRARLRAFGKWWWSPARVVRLGDAPPTPQPPAEPQSQQPSQPQTSSQAQAPSAPVPTNTSLPMVTGIAGIGQLLTSTSGAWTNNPLELSYRWQRSTDGGASWVTIPGATTSQLTPLVASAEALVRSCVTAAGAAGAACSPPFGPLGRGPAVGSQDDRLPVRPLGELAARQDAQAAAGQTVARVDLFWGDIAPTEPNAPGHGPTDPNDPAYDWVRTDQILQKYADLGIMPIVSFYDVPDWLAPQGPPSGTPVNPHVPLAPGAWGPFTADVAAFVTALLTRYNGVGRPRIEYLEAWNEPNKIAFLRRDDLGTITKITPAEYAVLAEAVTDAAKAVDPNVFVLVGGLGSGGDARTFLQALIDHPTDIDADAFSQHLYPADEPLLDRGQDQISADCDNQIGVVPYPSWQSLYEITCRLDAWKPGLPIIVTEAGYSTQASSARPAGSEVTEAEQAQYLRDIFSVPQVVAGRVAGVIWFNFQGNNGGGAGWPAGLVAYAHDFDPADNIPSNWTTLSRTGPGGGAPIPGLLKPSYTAFVDVLSVRSGVPLPTAS